jgi:hypothetical protein
MDNLNKALSIVGSSRSNGDRQKDDFYPTPQYVVEDLLNREKFNGKIWEPACGDGAMTDIFKKFGYETYSSDIIDRGYGNSGIDFLKCDTNNGCSSIITNPPYSIALEFVLKAKELLTDDNAKIAMFLKTVFLESSGRYEMFQDKEFPLKSIYQFSKRVSLYKDGKKMTNGGMIAYAWYVWDKSYIGKPTVEWIL